MKSNNCRFDSLVSELCFEIDELEAALASARAERDEWARKYAKLVSDDLDHGQRMSVGLLALAPIDRPLAKKLAEHVVA